MSKRDRWISFSVGTASLFLGGFALGLGVVAPTDVVFITLGSVVGVLGAGFMYGTCLDFYREGWVELWRDLERESQDERDSLWDHERDRDTRDASKSPRDDDNRPQDDRTND